MPVSSSMQILLIAAWGVILFAAAFAFGLLIVSAVVRFRTGKMTATERVGLSLGTGLGAMGMLQFWLSLLGVRQSDKVVFVAGIVSTMLLFFFRRSLFKEPSSRFSLHGIAKIDFVLVLLCSAAMALVLLCSLFWPFTEWDSVFIWGFKGRVLADSQLLPKPWAFTDLSSSYSHLDYPLLLPFLYASGYQFAGSYFDPCAKVPLVLIFVAFVFMFYSAVRWKCSRTISFALTALVTTLPSVLRWAGTGNADMALTFFYTGAVIYFIRWIETGDSVDLSFATLFGVFAAFTKSEGIALLLVNFVLTFVVSFRKRKSWNALLFSFLATVILLFPWLAWGADVPKTHEDYAGQLGMVFVNANRLQTILPRFFEEFTQWRNWGCLWFTLAIAAVIFWRAFRVRYVCCAWLFLLVHLALYVFVFVITPWNLEELFVAALERLFLHAAPTGALLIGFHCPFAKSMTNHDEQGKSWLNAGG